MFNWFFYRLAELKKKQEEEAILAEEKKKADAEAAKYVLYIVQCTYKRTVFKFWILFTD